MSILLKGDSWASLSVAPLADAFPGSEVIDQTEGGATAIQLAANLSEPPLGVEWVYLSAGALDEAFGTSAEFTRAAVYEIYRYYARRGLTTVHAGYNDPWFPVFPGISKQSMRSYRYVNMVHLDPQVELVDWGHLRTQDYELRAEYVRWYLYSPYGFLFD
jgi:hypothetical protein